MKKLYFLLFLQALAFAVFAQANEFGLGYQLSLPQSEMKNGWNAGHGIQLSYFRHFEKAKWLSVGGNFGIGGYAMETQPQEYMFRDGTITNTDVILSSSLGSAALSTRMTAFTSKTVMPFVELQSGYFWMYSSLYIEDPSDPFGCKALESKTLVNSGTFFGSVGGGVQILLGKANYRGRHLLEMGARSVFGNNLEYANMNRIYNDHEVTSEPLPAKGEKPLMVTFINVSTNEQHEHSVAELYNHPLRALQFNVQYAYRFGK